MLYFFSATLQISYLLDEVKLYNKKTKPIEDFLHLLYKFLNDLEPTKKHDVSMSFEMHLQLSRLQECYIKTIPCQSVHQ